MARPDPQNQDGHEKSLVFILKAIGSLVLWLDGPLPAPPPKDVEVITPVPVNVTLFGNLIFADGQVETTRGTPMQ